MPPIIYLSLFAAAKTGFFFGTPKKAWGVGRFVAKRRRELMTWTRSQVTRARKDGLVNDKRTEELLADIKFLRSSVDNGWSSKKEFAALLRLAAFLSEVGSNSLGSTIEEYVKRGEALLREAVA